MTYQEYEIHYGYNGVNSAHYILQGFNDATKVLETIDKMLENSSYGYCYVIRVQKEKLSYEDLMSERRNRL